MSGLEEKIAHLMRAVDDLSDVVAGQADALDKLARQMAVLMAREADRGGEGGAVLTGERPPHW